MARRTLTPTRKRTRAHTAILCMLLLRLKHVTPKAPKLILMNRPAPTFIPESFSLRSISCKAQVPTMTSPTFCLVPSRAPRPFARPPRSVPPSLPRAHPALSLTPACNPRSCSYKFVGRPLRKLRKTNHELNPGASNAFRCMTRASPRRWMMTTPPWTPLAKLRKKAL